MCPRVTDIDSLKNDTPSQPSTELKPLPQKRYYRQRAHSNPMSDHNLDYPTTPSDKDWSDVYPSETVDLSLEKVTCLDIGCGYGGLLIQLAECLPDRLILGLEIRVKVSTYVKQRIKALQSKHTNDPKNNPIPYNRIGCIRSNAMKLLPNFFQKGQIEKMFFLFPDPHFKKRKNKWRIVSNELLAEYAYCLKVGGIVYTITDVKEVYDWTLEKFEEHSLFERISEEEIKDDPAYRAIFNSTEEGQKVARNEGAKYPACFRRIESTVTDFDLL